MRSDLPNQLRLARGGILGYVPSAVSIARVLLAALLVASISDWTTAIPFVAFIGVLLVFVLDAVDGVLARRLGCQSLVGSFIDIAADRFVEFIFLQHFVTAGLIPLWFVLVFYVRILLTDACRLHAFGLEKVVASGILLPQRRAFFVLSKLSRSIYAALKGVLFYVLFLAMYRGETSPSTIELVVMLSVLGFSIMRAIPILITYLPRRIELTSTRMVSHARTLPQNFVTRTTKITSYIQLASDFCLAAILVMLAYH